MLQGLAGRHSESYSIWALCAKPDIKARGISKICATEGKHWQHDRSPKVVLHLHVHLHNCKCMRCTFIITLASLSSSISMEENSCSRSSSAVKPCSVLVLQWQGTRDTLGGRCFIFQWMRPALRSVHHNVELWTSSGQET